MQSLANNFKTYREFVLEKEAAELSGFLFEGGAFGHMSHPYDDVNLTFKEIKDMISTALQGGLDKEVVPSEKLDGQAIAVSWKDGELVAARNKGHYRDGAAGAMTVQQVIDKFEGRGDLSDAFSFAIKDLSQAISRIDAKKREEIFKNGKAFMHLELIYPPTTNVVNYDAYKLIFHSATEYDEAGNPVGEDKAAAGLLTKLIKDVNADIQKTYQIDPPKAIQFTKNINFEADRAEFFKDLAKIQKDANLPDGASIRDYIRQEYTNLLTGAAAKYGYEIPNNILEGLIRRFAFLDKSYKIPQIKKDITNKDFLDWVLKFDKTGVKDYYKQVIGPIELLFLKLGVRVIKLATGFLATNPDNTIQTIKKELEKTIKDVRGSGNEAKVAKLETELKRLEAIGGFDAVVPSEGIVFQHKGKTYKLTGAFAPINQILGTIKYMK
jgi:hypothetical protein